MVQRLRKRKNPKVTYLLTRNAASAKVEVERKSKYIDQGNILMLMVSNTVLHLSADVIKVVADAVLYR